MDMLAARDDGVDCILGYGNLQSSTVCHLLRQLSMLGTKPIAIQHTDQVKNADTRVLFMG